MLEACSKGLRVRKTVLTSAFLLATWIGASNHLTTQHQCKQLKKKKRYEKASFDPIPSWNKDLTLNVIWNFHISICACCFLLFACVLGTWTNRCDTNVSRKHSLCLQLDHTVLLCSCLSLIEDKRDSQGVVATFLKFIMHIKGLRGDLHINLYFFDKKTPISCIWDLNASSNLPTCNPHLHLLLTKGMKALGSYTS